MSTLEKRYVWDPVTRLWHWSLACTVIAGWCFGEFMSFTNIQWHFYCGYGVLGLLTFRLLWGTIGPKPARLGALVFTPRDTVRYAATLRSRDPSGTPGHNPLGSLSIIAMFILLAAQAGSGLFIESDDFFESGPLAHWVSEDTTLWLSSWHYTLSRVIAAVVLLHVAAVLYYLFWKRENLITAMLSGWKWVKPDRSDDPSNPD